MPELVCYGHLDVVLPKLAVELALSLKSELCQKHPALRHYWNMTERLRNAGKPHAPALQHRQMMAEGLRYDEKPQALGPTHALIRDKHLRYAEQPLAVGIMAERLGHAEMPHALQNRQMMAKRLRYAEKPHADVIQHPRYAEKPHALWPENVDMFHPKMKWSRCSQTAPLVAEASLLCH